MHKPAKKPKGSFNNTKAPMTKSLPTGKPQAKVVTGMPPAVC